MLIQVDEKICLDQNLQVDPLNIGIGVMMRDQIFNSLDHILREMALGADSSFSNEIMINRINSDLANGLGNLVSRTVAMVDKYFGGTLPEERQPGEFDDELIAAATVSDWCRTVAPPRSAWKKNW